MGWKGTMRSLQASSRKLELENERRRKQQTRIASIRNASDEVDQFEDYIRQITSFHTYAQEPINWKDILQKHPPEKPKSSDFITEQDAKERFALFSPNFLIKTFKKKKRFLNNF